MFVIRGDLSQADARTVFANSSLTAISDVILPADRCVWNYADPEYSPTTGQYEVNLVAFVMGNGTNVTVSNAELGYIGKSGRFVGISNG